MPDPQLDPLLTYLRENSGRDPLPDLRAHLLSQRWPVELVDRAIARYQEEQGATQPGMLQTAASVSGGPGPLAMTLLVLAILAGVGLMLVGTCFGLIGFLGASSQARLTWLAGATVVFLIGLALLILPIRRFRRSRRS